MVFDVSAEEFLKPSLLARLAEYYPNFFKKSNIEALEHETETAGRRWWQDLNKLPVAFVQLLKEV